MIPGVEHDPDYVHPPAGEVREAVRRALAEDLTPLGDLTSVLVDAGAQATAAFIPRAPGVVAGIRCATESFQQIDPAVDVRWEVDDGAAVVAGEAFGVVTGRLRSILTAERTALNFLGHLSGIATATARVVERAATGGPARVWDTRKTIPGERSLAKAAVRAGGGRNHRGNLSDAIMVKDNHLTDLGVAEGVARARDRWPNRIVHVECERIDQMEAAILAGADGVLLDNMSPEEVRECVRLAGEIQRGSLRRCLIEASGGITIENVSAYAATGVDLVSLGAITNSAAVLDIGLDVQVG